MPTMLGPTLEKLTMAGINTRWFKAAIDDALDYTSRCDVHNTLAAMMVVGEEAEGLARAINERERREHADVRTARNLLLDLTAAAAEEVMLALKTNQCKCW